MCRRFHLLPQWPRLRRRRYWTLIDTLCLTGVLLFVLELGLPFIHSRLMDRDHSTPDEYALLQDIRKASTAARRAELIAAIENVPIDIYPFHHRWLLINDVAPFACWDDSGYDHARSTVPRDIQLLWAASYGKADIDNGGFHQFFTNWTGIFAPEMVEWFDRAGLPEAAQVIREALAVFGEDYSRSQEERQAFLDKFRDTDEDDWDPAWDPFDKLNGRFLPTSEDQQAFDKAADEWLRNVCGIRSLHDQWQP